MGRTGRRRGHKSDDGHRGMSRPADHATAFALVTATLTIAHQISGKATRDALFLSYYGVEALPKMVMGAAVVSFVAVVVMSRLLARFGPARVIPAAFGASALVFVAIWHLQATAPGPAAIALYVHMSVFGAVLISGFWSLVNERFDPHAAKQNVARIAAAATLGGVIGGVMAERVVAVLDARAMLLVLALLHVACMLSSLRIGGSGRVHGTRHTNGLLTDLRKLVDERYLTWMALLTVLVAIAAALIDYAFKASATEQIADSEAMVAFFARFYAVIGLATFVVQSLLGPTMLRRCGIGLTLAVLPLILVVGGITALAVPRIWSVVVLRAGQGVVWNSFFRSAFELLYTPLPPSAKRPTKTIIDVAADRAGDLIGGALTLAVLALVPFAPIEATVAMAIVVALALLGVVFVLHRGYVRQLEVSLRDGAISLSEDQILDATTRQTFAETSGTAERALLLERIKAARRQRLGLESAAPRETGQGGAIASAAPPTQTARLVAAVEALSSGNVKAVRGFLTGDFMDDRLVPHLVPLLAEDALAEDVRMELRWIAPRVIGALTDALLDPDLAVRARQRIPGVLEVTHNDRAVDALMRGLGEHSFNVRYSCARALARMTARDPDIRPDPETIYRAVLDEVASPPQHFGHLDVTLEIDLGVDFETNPTRVAAANYGLEYVFTLLSLVHDRDALQLSFQALFSSDRNLRGTALEYLENVLPDAVRRGLWPHLGISVASAAPPRSPQVLLSELRRLGGLARPGS